MRGWLHAGMFPLALGGGIVVVVLARSTGVALACSVYAVSALLLFGTSAVYHRGKWGPRGEAVLRRLDHANIFVIIAGTYTPLAVLLLPAHRQVVLLSFVWAGAVAGIVFRVWRIRAPRWLYTLCYVALGWAAVFYLPAFAHTGGTAVAVLITVGGLLYSTGAVVYGLKRPDPSPRWFGFHEVFHALTTAAYTAHYTAIVLAATRLEFGTCRSAGTRGQALAAYGPRGAGRPGHCGAARCVGNYGPRGVPPPTGRVQGDVCAYLGHRLRVGERHVERVLSGPAG